MAMIKCPKCKNDISDKSTKCVHCGYIINEEPKVLCEECGAEINPNDEICNKCGCPIKKKEETEEVAKVKIVTGISKKKVILGIIILLLIGGTIFGGISYKNYSDKKKAEEISEQYKSNLRTVTYKMLDGAAKAESCGNLIRKVWSNSIWKESNSETDKYTKKNGKFNEDFNASITALFADPNFSEKTDEVEDNQKDVNKLMKDMKNPPEEWKDAYEDLKSYYDSYLTLTNLCTNPTGSLQTYSTNFSNADTDTVNKYEKMKSYLDY